MTIKQAYSSLSDYLHRQGVESPDFDAAQLVAAVTGVTKAKMPIEGTRPLTPLELERLTQLAKRRGERYPLQYLLGEWEFYGIPMAVGEGVLIPRADTETLVETGLTLLKGVSRPVVYDLCSGSGCIAAAIAKYRPDAIVYAVELSKEALPYLRKNTAAFPGIRVVEGDVLEVGSQLQLPACHLLLSNPPYISDSEMQQLQSEVRYEPEMALRAENDGLYFYQQISSLYHSRLLEEGAMAFEVGYTQSAPVSRILRQAGMKEVFTCKDLNGIERVVVGKK